MQTGNSKPTKKNNLCFTHVHNFPVGRQGLEKNINQQYDNKN